MSPCDSGRLVGVCLQGLEIRCVALPHVSFPRKESSDCVALISGSFNAPFYGRSGCDLFDIVQTSVGEEWLASHSRVSVRGVVLINPKFSPDWPQCSQSTDLIDLRHGLACSQQVDSQDQRVRVEAPWFSVFLWLA